MTKIQWTDWTDKTKRRFWSGIDMPREGCWEWPQGKFAGSDYGQFRVGKRKVRAHRLAWEMSHGRPIPDGMIVCHSCDNPSCVKPAHLFLGTHADNARDRDHKGRGTRGRKRPEAASPGELNPAAILNKAQVLSIRRLRAQGHTYSVIAERHGVAKSTIAAVVRRETWRHI